MSGHTHTIKTVIYYIISFYVVITIFAYFFATNLIFLPPQPGYQDSYSIIKIKAPDHNTIAALYLKNRHAKHTIFISHGNAEDIGYMLPFLEKWYNDGYSVFTYDYAGYGLSSGHPSEKQLYQDADIAYNYLVKELKVNPQNIVGYGRSLGAAVTIELALKHKMAGIILQSPFLSAFRVVTKIPLLPFDQFDNLNKIAKITIPKLFIHGTADKIVPFNQGQELYRLAKQPKKYYWVAGAGHNNLLQYSGSTQYFKEIHKFIEKI